MVVPLSKISVLFPQKMQLVAIGLLEFWLDIAPPSKRLEFPEKEQLNRIGEEDRSLIMPPPLLPPPVLPENRQLVRVGEEERSLYMPPPLFAEFPVNVHWVMIGEAPLTLAIPPPPGLPPILLVKAQLVIVGEEETLVKPAP